MRKVGMGIFRLRRICLGHDVLDSVSDSDTCEDTHYDTAKSLTVCIGWAPGLEPAAV